MAVLQRKWRTTEWIRPNTASTVTEQALPPSHQYPISFTQLKVSWSTILARQLLTAGNAILYRTLARTLCRYESSLILFMHRRRRSAKSSWILSSFSLNLKDQYQEFTFSMIRTVFLKQQLCPPY